MIEEHLLAAVKKGFLVEGVLRQKKNYKSNPTLDIFFRMWVTFDARKHSGSLSGSN